MVRARVKWFVYFVKWLRVFCQIYSVVVSSPGSRNLLWGGAVYQRGGNVCEAVWTEEGGAVRLRRGGGGGGGGAVRLRRGGGGGCSRQVTLINSSLTCTHSLLKHKKHHGKRVHSAPALSCSTASLTFVRTTELSGLLSMAQHVICRSLSSGRGGGGGGGKSCQGAAFHTRWGGRPPPPRLCWIRGWSLASIDSTAQSSNYTLEACFML